MTIKNNIGNNANPQVYGETSFEMIDQLIEDVPFKKGATFLDLGSGVGQVVLQVAASNICRICYGIEQAATPCYYARVSSISCHSFRFAFEWCLSLHVDPIWYNLSSG